MIGKKKLTGKDKEVLRGLVGNTCEGCLKHEDEVGKLSPHRLTPGYQGGSYRPGNIQMLCNKCHKGRAEQW